MRRLFPPRFSWALVGIAAVAAISGSALAFFTSAGLGTAEAKVSKLTKPAITAATAAAGGTVSLSWSAATAPGAEAVKYYVTRDGEDAGGTCAMEATPTAATSCVDKELDPGKYTYTVTAVWRSWSNASSASSATVEIGPADHFTIAAATTTPAVSVADVLTITAVDANGKTVTTYAGNHTLVFSGASSSPIGTAPTIANSSGTATSFGTGTVISFTGGVAGVITTTKNGVLKIYKAGPANVVATESSSSITTPVPLALTVVPGAATKYTLTATTTTPVAGVGDDLTITALDAYGNTATAYTGSHNLVFSGAVASAGGNLPTVSDSAGNDVAFGTATPIVFTAGVAKAEEDENGEMTLYKSATAAKVVATEGTIVNTFVSVTPTAAAAAKLVLTAATLTPVAAASDNLTTTAQDPYGNTATSYTGSHSITFSGATTSPSGAAANVINTAGTAINFGAATVLTFTSGATATRVLKLNKAEVASVTATDGTISTATPVTFTVSVGAASRWALTSLTASAGSIAPPCLFTCAITLLGNGGTVSANVSVTDGVGNIVSELGSGHTAKVTVAGTAGATVADGASLAIPATGPAVSATRFTYTAPASGAFSNTITAAALAGTAYTTATATPSK
ncbi:MAG TPA: fibronectin type III domain-containing protein [Solirubrobacterales bacterium]|nr:fibronectin type III domain-containing protein [Solirubrobacterales bacterium]